MNICKMKKNHKEGCCRFWVSVVAALRARPLLLAIFMTGSVQSETLGASQCADSAPPPTYKLENVVISMSRTGCLGECPVYSIEIKGNGVVNYSGERHVASKGKYTSFVESDTVVALLNRFYRARFFTLDDKYRGWKEASLVGNRIELLPQKVTDHPGTVISINIDDYRKTVTGGYTQPQEFTELALEIDRVSGSAQWIAGPAE